MRKQRIRQPKTKPIDRFVLYTLGVVIIGGLVLFLIAFFRMTTTPNKIVIGIPIVFLSVALYSYIKIFRKFLKEGRR